MSRSGYSDDCDNVALWRQAVARATLGRRGQALLHEMLTALDALPEQRLISGDLINAEGECCALGAVACLRNADVAHVDPADREQLGEMFGVAPALAAEIMYLNDERGPAQETPEERFQRMRQWLLAAVGSGTE